MRSRPHRHCLKGELCGGDDSAVGSGVVYILQLAAISVDCIASHRSSVAEAMVNNGNRKPQDRDSARVWASLHLHIDRGVGKALRQRPNLKVARQGVNLLGQVPVHYVRGSLYVLGPDSNFVDRVWCETSNGVAEDALLHRPHLHIVEAERVQEVGVGWHPGDGRAGCANSCGSQVGRPKGSIFTNHHCAGCLWRTLAIRAHCFHRYPVHLAKVITVRDSLEGLLARLHYFLHLPIDQHLVTVKRSGLRLRMAPTNHK